MLEARGLNSDRPPRTPIRSYEDIEAYQRAMGLIPAIHQLAGALPAYERHDLASQMRRAAKSIPANIAEGYARRESVKDFRNYLRIAMASANEMEVHLQIAADLGYVERSKADDLRSEYGVVGRQLNRLIASWRHLQPPASSLKHRGS
jgi:four helix bundle protein